MPRGFAAVALANPKNPHNVGGVFRAASCYGADLVIVGGKRSINTLRWISTDTQKAWKHMPVLQVEDPFDAMLLGAIPVAIELVPNAKPLPIFNHPERAFYLFGPEDGTLGGKMLDRCTMRVVIPTAFCMNLAATVNVVLYDRMAKRLIAEARLVA